MRHFVKILIVSIYLLLASLSICVANASSTVQNVGSNQEYGSIDLPSQLDNQFQSDTLIFYFSHSCGQSFVPIGTRSNCKPAPHLASIVNIVEHLQKVTIKNCCRSVSVISIAFPSYKRSEPFCWFT